MTWRGATTGASLVRRLRTAIVVALGVIALTLALGQRFGDPSLAPRQGEAVVTVQIVDYGFHAALFVPRDALLEAAALAGASKLVAVAKRFAAYDTLELGWGDEDFYRTVPSVADLRMGLALSAAFGFDTRTVLLVVGHMEPVDTPFPGDGRALVKLSSRAFARMIPELEATLAGGSAPEELGVGLYGPSLFYRATGHYSLLNVCNHWLARLMLAGGRSVNLTLATLSPLLVWQMR